MAERKKQPREERRNPPRQSENCKEKKATHVVAQGFDMMAFLCEVCAQRQWSKGWPVWELASPNDT